LPQPRPWPIPPQHGPNMLKHNSLEMSFIVNSVVAMAYWSCVYGQSGTSCVVDDNGTSVGALPRYGASWVHFAFDGAQRRSSNTTQMPSRIDSSWSRGTSLDCCAISGAVARRRTQVRISGKRLSTNNLVIGTMTCQAL
jgi:hypothetical protein